MNRPWTISADIVKGIFHTECAHYQIINSGRYDNVISVETIDLSLVI